MKVNALYPFPYFRAKLSIFSPLFVSVCVWSGCRVRVPETQTTIADSNFEQPVHYQTTLAARVLRLLFFLFVSHA